MYVTLSVFVFNFQYISNIGSFMKPQSDSPSLVITKIDYISAKVILYCQQDDGKVQFNLKYAIDNQDEKKDDTNWIKINGINGNEYELKDLKYNTKYLVSAQCKVQELEWSDDSKQADFQTKAEPFAITKYSANQYDVTQNNTMIKGRIGHDCWGRFIYGPDNNGKGFRTGIHCWSVRNILNAGCYRQIGITTKRDQDINTKIEGQWISSGTNYIFTRYKDWSNGQTITVRVDFNNWKVSWYRSNEDKIETKDIAQNTGPYFFGLNVCNSPGRHWQCVETPSSFYQ